MKLKTQLILTFTSILLLFSLIIFFVIYLDVSSAITTNYEQIIMSDSKMSMAFFNEKYPGDWNVKNNALYKGTEKINESTKFVDSIRNSSGYLATFFLNNIRISTNVTSSDGKRITGKPASDIVAKTVLNEGKDYKGPALVSGKNCFTYYTPLKDNSGKIIGMWFLGIDKTVVDNKILSIVRSIGIIMLAVLLLGILVAYFLGNRLSSHIIEINNNLHKFAEGDFSCQISEKAKSALGEIGQMSKSAHTMHVSITGIIQTIISESKNIDSSLDSSSKSIAELNSNIIEVSATTEQISAGMQQTAASMQEMNATSADIESSIENIAKKAIETAAAANDISKLAENLKNSAKNSKDYAYEIYSTSNTELKNAIEQSKSIEQIKLLSDAIMQITSQTNLLALNASIEASRAGESGRGFAVVADEIRKLAEDSKITVSQIQKVTKIVLAAVEHLVSSSQNILNFIENTVISDYDNQVSSSEQYSNNANHISVLVNNFSDTSEQLLVQINNMLKAINEVTLSTNESAEGTADIAARAAEIMDKGSDVVRLAETSKASANTLKNYVSNFKI